MFGMKYSQPCKRLKMYDVWYKMIQSAIPYKYLIFAITFAATQSNSLLMCQFLNSGGVVGTAQN